MSSIHVSFVNIGVPGLSVSRELDFFFLSSHSFAHVRLVIRTSFLSHKKKKKKKKKKKTNKQTNQPTKQTNKNKNNTNKQKTNKQ